MIEHGGAVREFIIKMVLLQVFDDKVMLLSAWI